MAFHVVGAVAVKIRPDSTDFKEEAKAQLKKEANGLEVEINLEPGDLDRSEIASKVRTAQASAKNLKVKIPVELDESELKKADVERLTKRLSQRLSDNGDSSLRLSVDSQKALADVRGTLFSVQREVSKSPLDLHFNTDLRLKEAQRKWQAEMDAQRLHAKVLADFDVNDFVRQVDHLQRDSRIALKPDVEKTFQELEGVEFKLKTDIDFRRDRIQKNLDELSKLNPLMLSTDPQINTKEVRERWALLKRELEADRVDLKFDQDRLVKVQGLLENVDVDSNAINRSVDKLFKNMHTTLHPDVELDVNKLRNLDVNLQADIEIKKQDIAAKMAELNRLKAAVLSIDPEINTPKVRAQFESLKKEIEAQQIELRADIDRRNRIAPLIADVDVDVASINRSLEMANRHLTALLHPDIELDRKKLRDLDVQIDADINFRRERVQRTLREMEELKPFILSVDPELNTEEVRKQWDHLKRELNNDTVDLKADLDRQSKVRAQIAELTRNRNVDILVRIEKRSLATAKATLEALAGVNLFRRTGLFLERIATNLDNYALKVGKLGILLGNLSNVLGSASASVIAFGAQLGQLGGFALGAPAGLLALVALGAAGKAAFQDFGDAVGGSQEALERLPKQAQTAARELQGVWGEIQRPAQTAFWEGMGDSLTTFVHQSLPQVRSGLADVAGAMGKVFGDGLQGLTEFARKGLIGDLLTQLSRGLKNMAPGAYSIADAFVTMGDAGASYFPRIGGYLADMADKFDRWIRKAESSGKLNEWMENAVDTASKLKNGIKDLVGIFSGVADAARRAGSGGISAFASQMDRIREIVEGPIFQGTMTTLFEGARGGAQALYKALGPLGDTLAKLAPDLKTVFVSVGDTLGNLLSSIATAMQSPLFSGGLVDLFSGIQSGFAGFSEYLPGIVDGLGSLGSILGSVFASALPVVGRGFDIIAGAFEKLAPSLKTLGQSLGSIADDGLSAIAGVLPGLTGPLQIALDIFNALPDPVKSTMAAFILFRPVALGLAGIIGKLGLAMSGLRTGGGIGAFGALKSMLGTGLAVAGLVAVSQGFSAIGDEAKYAEASARSALDTAKAVSTAKTNNPFNPLGNQETLDAAGAKVDAFLEEMAQKGIKFASSKQALMDVVLGVNSPDAQKAKTELSSIYSLADSASGNGFSRFMEGMLSFGNSTNGKDWKNTATGIQDFLNISGEINKQDYQQWFDEGGRFKAINALASASLEQFGRITAKNVPLLKKSLDGSRKDLTGYSAEAEIMASTLGLTADEASVKGMQLASALKIYGDSPRGIARAATKLGLTGAEMSKIMAAVGISAEEMADASRYGFGSVAEATGLLGSSLAYNTPLLYEGSDGFTELARGLSETTGLDTSFLSNTLRSTGGDAVKMAADLQAAGVPMSQVKDILGDLGYPASEAAAAISNLAKEVPKAETWSTAAAMEFSAALDAIARAGGDARTQAEGLRNAIDRLNGGTLSTDRQIAAFDAAVAAAQSAFSLSDAEIADMGPSWTGWGDAIDDVTGKINTQTAAGQKLFSAVDSLGSEALATANDAFKKTYESTGDLTQASGAARTAIEGQIEAFKKSAKAAGLTDQEIASLLTRFHLWPDELATAVSVNAVDADSDLQGIVGMMSQIKPGVTTKVGILDNGAVQKLEDLGVQVHQLSDGSYEITLAADPTVAKGQVDGFVQYASTQVGTIDIEAAQDRAQKALETFLRSVAAAQAWLKINGNPEPAQQKAKGLLGWIDGLIGAVTTGNNTDPATGKTKGLMGWISSLIGYIQTGNNTSPAQGTTQGLMGWISSLWGNVNTGADTGKAQGDTWSILDWIDLQSASVTVNAVAGSVAGAVNSIRNQIGSALGFSSANGNIWDGGYRLEQFANGGFSMAKRTYGSKGRERHSAFITRTLRVFGEPETGGEAYIPLALRKRQRSTKILNSVADKFGLATIPKMQARIRQYADGAVVGGGSSTGGIGGSNVTIIQNYPQTEPDSVGVMRAGQLVAAQGTL